MISRRYFAFKPKAILLRSLSDMGLPNEVAESELWSKKCYDRIPNDLKDDVYKMKSMYLAQFHHRIEVECGERGIKIPVQVEKFSFTSFDRYWELDVFDGCEEYEDVAE